MDSSGMSYIAWMYDAKLLKKLNEDLSIRGFSNHPFPPLTAEELRRIEVRDRWYKRRIDRVRRVMAAYHVSGSELCDCDY
jgi:hypothetical protein